MSRNSLLEAGAKYEFEVTATGFEPRTTYVYVTRQEHTVKCTVQISAQNTVQSVQSVQLSVCLRTKWFWD